MSSFILVNQRELATILAALRYHQAENLQGSATIADEAIRAIATDHGHMRALNASQIDALCQRINSQDTPAVWITVAGGVTEIAKKPSGIEVRIFDYDVDGTGQVDRDPDDKPCIIQVSPASSSVGVGRRR
jgi:hypothetical protein